MGHVTFCCLCRRQLLSIFHSTYRFINACYVKVTRIWESVLDELRCFVGLMPFLESDWARQWNEMVVATDASEAGFGVSTSKWSKAEVAKVGRLQERNRYKWESAREARRHAMEAGGFAWDPYLDRWTARSPDMEDLGEWHVDQGFEEVPGQKLRADRWQGRLSGRWHWKDGILRLEARSLVLGFRRMAISRYGRNSRQLALCDNMSVVLAFNRCRAKDFGLLKQIRRAAAYSLSRNIGLSVRWIPSELNSADRGSRKHDSGYRGDKDLTESIAFREPPGLEGMSVVKPSFEPGLHDRFEPSPAGQPRALGGSKEPGRPSRCPPAVLRRSKARFIGQLSSADSGPEPQTASLASGSENPTKAINIE